MVKSRTIRWGVVGCGWVARDYVIPAIEAASNADLVAVCDRNPDAVKGFRNSSLPDLLTGDIDAVYVATPNDSHEAVVTQAAAAGKHVLCEKPMSTTYAGAEQMVQDCAAAGVVYATAFDQRFHPAHMRLREMIAQGDFGTVTSARIHYACWLGPGWSADNWRIDPQRAGGGAFIDLAPHGIDLLQYLLDDRFTDFHCLKQNRVFRYSVDDGAVATGRFANGCLATLQVAYNCPEVFPRRTLEIIGTAAMATARNTMGQTPGGSVDVLSSDGTVQPVAFSQNRSPFLNQIEAFAQCLLDGKPFPFPPQRDLETMRIVSTCL